MKDSHLQEILAHLGFDTRESAVYLALLELGEASVQQIAGHAKIERTGTYDLLRRLMERGFVSETYRGKRRVFLAEPPHKLQDLLKARLSQLSELLPSLESLYNRHQVKPKIRFYEGTEGLKTVLEDTLTAPDKELRGILSVFDLFDVLGEKYMEHYVSRRVVAGVNLRVIRSKPKEVGERWPTDPKALRELRYAPAGMIFTMTTYFYGTKVALLSSRKENFGLIIDSEELSTTQHHLFDALWQASCPPED